MESRFEESFNELGLIYEAYYTAQKAGGQKDSVEGNHSYRKGTFSTPQGSVNQYQANSISNTTAPVSDEEKEVDPIIVKLEELQKEAEADGMDYAVLQLATLKKFIEES
jgi:hypothetical protein